LQDACFCEDDNEVWEASESVVSVLWKFYRRMLLHRASCLLVQPQKCRGISLYSDVGPKGYCTPVAVSYRYAEHITNMLGFVYYP